MYKGFIISLLLLLTCLAEAQWYPKIMITGRLFDVAFINSDTGWVVGEAGIIQKTTDGGANWFNQTSGTNVTLHSITFKDELTGIVVGLGGKIRITNDGGNTWTVVYSGTNNTIWDVEYLDSLTLIASCNSGYLRSVNGGYNWAFTYLGNGFGSGLAVEFYDRMNGWMASPYYILKTTDGGITWNSQTYNSTIEEISAPDSNIIFAAGWNGRIFKTTNGGIDWMNIRSGEDDLFGIFCTDINNCTAVGEYGTIIRTTDGGLTWIDQSTTIAPHLFRVYFDDENTGWAAGYSYVFKTLNGGGVPVELTSFYASVSANNVLLNWTTASELNNYGFEIERKNSEVWNTIGFVTGNGTSSEINNYSFTDDLSYLGSGSTVYYRLKQVDYDGSFEYSQEVQITFAAEYSLSQNYPNPFNPTTTISYAVPAYSDVTIKIFNVLGQQVASLVNEEKPAGRYEVVWNAEGFTSGIYFYTIQAGSFAETKKMIIMK